MAALLVVVQDSKRSATQLARDLDRSGKRNAGRSLLNYFRAVLSSLGLAYITTQVSGAFASQTITVSQAAAVNDTDTLTIAGSVGGTLSVKASPANENQVSKGATNAAFAANVVAKINAHTTLSKIVRAKVTGAAQLTVYSKVPGLLGNLVTLAEAGNGFTLTGAALAGGTSDEADHFEFGYDPTV
jgi:hypothetical protein